MPEFLIREASDEDGPALTRLVERATAAIRPDGEPASLRPELDRPASYFSERGGRLWVVLRAGEVAGSLGLMAHARPGEFELSMISFEEDARGQGLAAALIAGANAFAAASGGERLSAWLDARLTDGGKFLERHGFVQLPGTRAARDGSDALEHHYERAVTFNSPLDEDRPAGAA